MPSTLQIPSTSITNNDNDSKKLNEIKSPSKVTIKRERLRKK